MARYLRPSRIREVVTWFGRSSTLRVGCTNTILLQIADSIGRPSSVHPYADSPKNREGRRYRALPQPPLIRGRTFLNPRAARRMCPISVLSARRLGRDGWRPFSELNPAARIPPANPDDRIYEPYAARR